MRDRALEISGKTHLMLLVLRTNSKYLMKRTRNYENVRKYSFGRAISIESSLLKFFHERRMGCYGVTRITWCNLYDTEEKHFTFSEDKNTYLIPVGWNQGFPNFHTKNPNSGIPWRALECIMLVYFIAIWYIMYVVI
jgi:hypothetical protein